MIHRARPAVDGARALLAYTTLFEKVVDTATSKAAEYAALTAVAGAGGSVTITAPSVAATLLTTKNAFHFGVVNYDGAGTVTIDGNGHNINGGSTIVLPATAGAFAFVWLDVATATWKALVSTAGGAFTPPPTYTTTAPLLQYAITTTPTAIPQAAITTAPFTAQQKAIVTWSATVQTDAGFQDNNIFRMFDGVVGTTIDAFEQTCGNSAVDNLPAFDAVSWTLRVDGNGSARTFGLGVSGATGGHCVIPSLAVRGVVQIVDG